MKKIDEAVTGLVKRSLKRSQSELLNSFGRTSHCKSATRLLDSFYMSVGRCSLSSLVGSVFRGRFSRADSSH